MTQYILKKLFRLSILTQCFKRENAKFTPDNPINNRIINFNAISMLI